MITPQQVQWPKKSYCFFTLQLWQILRGVGEKSMPDGSRGEDATAWLLWNHLGRNVIAAEGYGKIRLDSGPHQPRVAAQP